MDRADKRSIFDLLRVEQLLHYHADGDMMSPI